MLFAALTAIGAVVMCQAAFAQDTTTTTTTTTNNGSTMTSTTVSTQGMSDRLSVSDQIFLMDLMHANAEEIELSRIARRQANSTGVSDFARHMIDDHSNLQSQLMTTYGGQPWVGMWVRYHPIPNDVGMSYYNENNNGNMTMPSGGWSNWQFLDSSDWDKVRRLEGLEGNAFDREYLEMMVQGHHQLMEKIWRHQPVTMNSSITTLIGQVQPTVQAHLEMARGLSFAFHDPFDVRRSSPWIH
jgi:putative membrane protein